LWGERFWQISCASARLVRPALDLALNKIDEGAESISAPSFRGALLMGRSRLCARRPPPRGIR
jgi:hypothetical protein